jgi:hypothetical protein
LEREGGASGMIPGYASPENIGHKLLEHFWDEGGVAEFTEKIDGSNAGFGLGADGALRMRSHHKQLDMDNADKMFAPAVQTVKELNSKRLLTPGYIYWGEVLAKPKANTLAYSRTPKGCIILYDVDRANGGWDCMAHAEMAMEASRLGLESVPLIATFTKKPSLDELTALLDRESILGGVKIEGVVGKRLDLFSRDGRPLMLKYVSDAFKEVHRSDWKERHPKQGDIVLRLIDTYGTEARWRKAIQHLREQGLIEDAPQDIGICLKEINADVLKECEQEIRDALWKWAWPQVARGITRGFPEFYKQQLVSGAFPSECGNITQEGK